MSNIVVGGDTYELPDETIASKTTLYNAALMALASNLSNGEAWAVWTPTWTNLSVGNGTVVAKYLRIGTMVFCRLSIIFGSTTSVSGSVSFSLPVTRAAIAGLAGLTPIGQIRMQDTSASLSRDGTLVSTSTTTATITVDDVSGTYRVAVVISSTAPFTWATTDEMACQWFYEAAP